MKEIKFSYHVDSVMEKYLEMVIEENRAQFREFGFDMDEQRILDMLFFECLKKECEKFGYKG